MRVFPSNVIGVCIGSSSSRWVVLARILVIIQINTQTHAHLHARTHSRTYVYTHTRARDTPHGVYNFHLSTTAGHLELKWKKSWCSTFFLFLFFSLSLSGKSRLPTVNRTSQSTCNMHPTAPNEHTFLLNFFFFIYFATTALYYSMYVYESLYCAIVRY